MNDAVAPAKAPAVTCSMGEYVDSWFKLFVDRKSSRIHSYAEKCTIWKGMFIMSVVGKDMKKAEGPSVRKVCQKQ